MTHHFPPVVRILPEIIIPGRRLGRHVEHDPRSRAHVMLLAAAPLETKSWAFLGDILDQGDVGSCTGEATVNALNCEPFVGRRGTLLTQEDALSIYEQATHLDAISGSYPPNDTGSTGIAASKAAKARGLIAGYKHAFSLASALAWLSHTGPIKIGIEWFEGFDTPQGADAECKIAGAVRGGHELCVNEINVEARKVRFIQSWGKSWGDSGHGVFSWDTLGALLGRQGDATLDHE